MLTGKDKIKTEGTCNNTDGKDIKTEEAAWVRQPPYHWRLSLFLAATNGGADANANVAVVLGLRHEPDATKIDL